MTFGPTARGWRSHLSSTTLAWLALSACSGSPILVTKDAGRDGPVSVPDGSQGVDARNDARDGRANDAISPSDVGAHDGPASDVHARDANEDARDGGERVDGHGHPDAMTKLDARPDTGFDAGPPAIRYIGRTLTDGSDPDGSGTPCTPSMPCFEWSGTAVVVRAKGAAAIALTMNDDGNYFDVYVDGTLQAGSPIVGIASQTSYTLASGLDPSKVHEVSLYKRTEASTASRTMIEGVTFPNGGTLLPPAEASARRIEVIGDSISCGYGVLGASGCSETPALEDHDQSFGAITARTLGADLYTIASSGRGMYRNANGSLTGTVPDIYGLTLPYVSSGAPSSWSFASWTPEAVVIDLGTNDFVLGDPGANFTATYLAFVKTVRHNYPGAYILCTNGPMLVDPSYSIAQSYIQSVVSMMADPKVAYLGFPSQSGAEGCDGHPSAATQAAMATQLTAALKTALAW